MNKSWFRMYDDILSDPKIQMLPAAIFKSWVNCLCIAAKNNGDCGDDKGLSFTLDRAAGRPSGSTIGSAHVIYMVELGLLERCGTNLTPHNWHIRQYKSDKSTQRVRDMRKRFRSVGETFRPPKQNAVGNVSVTVQNREESKTEAELTSKNSHANGSKFSASEKFPPASAELTTSVESKGWAPKKALQ